MLLFFCFLYMTDFKDGPSTFLCAYPNPFCVTGMGGRPLLLVVLLQTDSATVSGAERIPGKAQQAKKKTPGLGKHMLTGSTFHSCFP